jgi:phenylpyruvate tautomerase PptA (4-oxalocrotonate tautomerase family)
MPILEIEWVEKGGEQLPADIATHLAHVCGQALRAEPGRTWVRLRRLPTPGYGEDGQLPAGVAPVFVEVLMSRLPPVVQRAGVAQRLAQSVGETMGRPVANVHILFLPEAWERIAFGGNLLRDS